MLKKKTALLSVLVTITILIISGCNKTVTVVENPGNSITEEMSFATHIQPIFNKSCNGTGCHNAGGKAPNLSIPNAYASLNAGGYLKAGDADNSLLMLWLNGKKSPVMPVGAGPDAEINAKIYAWINQGAKNN
jgi:hypothetical protein